MRARYQNGVLTLIKRKTRPAVWQLRYFKDGKRQSTRIGTIQRLPTKADARRAVEHLMMEINSHVPETKFHAATVGALIDRFMEQHVPKHCRKLTASVYRSLFDKHIRPRWGTEIVTNVKTMAVQDWLEEMPDSRQVKAHVRGLMHTLFQVGMRWDLLDKNPVSLVRQSRKRLKKPRTLTPSEFKALHSQLDEPYKTMVLTTACLGLRVCELLGLQWDDIDFENLTVSVRRSLSEGEVCDTKTEASEAALPLDPDLAKALLEHKARADFAAGTGFVFAGKNGNPPWPDTIRADYLHPAAEKAGVGKVGWHSFRHTYSTLLHALGTTPEVQKELLRHADIQTTLNIYTQAVTEQKREAATKVADKLLRG